MDEESIARRLQLRFEPGTRPGGPRQGTHADAPEPVHPTEQPPSGPVGREDVPWDTPDAERWPTSDLQQLTLDDAAAPPPSGTSESEPALSAEPTTEAWGDEVPDEPWFVQPEAEPWLGDQPAEVSWDRPADVFESTDNIVADRPSWDRPSEDDLLAADSATEATVAMPEFEAVLARVAEQDPLASDPYDASAPVVSDLGEPSRTAWPSWDSQAGAGHATNESATDAVIETDAAADPDAAEHFSPASTPTLPVTLMETPTGPTPHDDLFDFPVASAPDPAAPEEPVPSETDDTMASGEPVIDAPAMPELRVEANDIARPDTGAADQLANWVLRIELAIEGKRLVPVEVTLRTPSGAAPSEVAPSAEAPTAGSDAESAVASAETMVPALADTAAAPLNETESPLPAEMASLPQSDEPPGPTDQAADSPAMMTAEILPEAGSPSADARPSEDPSLIWEAEEWPPRPFDPAAPAWPPTAEEEPPLTQTAPSWPPAADPPWASEPEPPTEPNQATGDMPEWPAEAPLADPHVGFEPVNDPLADIPAPPAVYPDEPVARSSAETLRADWRAGPEPDLRTGDSPAAEAAHEPSSIFTAGVTLGIGLIVVVLLFVFIQLMTSLLP